MKNDVISELEIIHKADCDYKLAETGAACNAATGGVANAAFGGRDDSADDKTCYALKMRPCMITSLNAAIAEENRHELHETEYGF